MNEALSSPEYWVNVIWDYICRNFAWGAGSVTAMKRRTVLFGLGSLGASPMFFLGGCESADPKSTISFANPSPVWWNAVPLIASQRKLYDAEDVTVRTFNVLTGVQSKEAILDDNAMMGVCTPNAISTTEDERLKDLRILGSVMQSSSTVAIISRKPFDQLTELKIGYVPSTISEFYLIAYLQKLGLLELYRQNRISLTKLSPIGLTTAISKRDVDAIVAWEPFATQAEAALRKAGDATFTGRDESLYSQQILILAHRTADATASGKVVRGLRSACAAISSDRGRAAAELESFFRFPAGYLSKSAVWSKVAFDFVIDAEQIRGALERDLELASIAKIAKNTGAQLGTVLSELK